MVSVGVLRPLDTVDPEVVSSTLTLLTNLQFVFMMVYAPLNDKMSRDFSPPGHIPNRILKVFGDVSVATALTKTT